MKDAACHIAIFAKAPVPGLAKTRLAPALGAQGAAALAERLLNHAVAQAVAAGLGPVTVWATPDVTHPAFTRLQAQHRVRLAVQCDGDLGARMAAAFARTLADDPATPMLLMGSDAPALDAAMLRQAAAALRDHAVVFVPALDGGYALVGLQAPLPPIDSLQAALRPLPPLRPLQALFNDRVWSTPQVMARTRARLAAAGLAHHELPAVADIDEPADLAHLPPGWRR